MNSKTTSQACSYDPLCLGMCDWTDCPGAGLGGANAELPHPLQTASSKACPRPCPFTEQQQQPSTTASTSSAQPLPPSERFQFADEKSLLELAKGCTPADTSRSTKWALAAFELWNQARNQHKPEAAVPHDLFTRCDPAMLSTSF